MKFPALLAATAATVLAVPAFAQSDDKADHFNGGYISIVGGKSLQPNDRGESLLFSNGTDGQFGDNFIDPSDESVIKPGFCNGAAKGAAELGCANDKDGAEYYARLGMDKRSGNFVIGGLIEAGRNESRDDVSAFVGDDYVTMSRKAKWNAGARLRAGYTPGGGALFYVTGGGAYARLKNSFATSRDGAAFTDSGKSNAWGWSAGGGAEVMLASNLALGLEYLYTDVKNDKYVVRAADGLLDNLGTDAVAVDMKRSNPNFRTHSVRGTLSMRF